MNWYFWTVMLEKTLVSPMDCKKIKPVDPKGNQSEYSLEGLMLKLRLQYFGHLMWRTNLLEKTLMLGKIEGSIKRGWQKIRWLDGITYVMDMSLRNSRNWWLTGKPGMLQSMGSQRVGHDRVTELNELILYYLLWIILLIFITKLRSRPIHNPIFLWLTVLLSYNSHILQLTR